MYIRKRSVISTFFWLLTIICCCKDLYAQSYITDIQKLSVEDGLSSRFTNTIYKDSRGFLWIGTQYGLNRYDGYEFKRYTSENSALTSNDIKEIHEDINQRLWIIQGSPYDPYRLGNIDILEPYTGQIRSFETLFKNDAPFNIKDIRIIYSNTPKELWFTTAKGMLYRYVDNRFEHVFSAPGQGILNVFYADEQYVWIYRNELLKIDRQGHVIQRIKFQDKVNSVGVDKNSNLWLFQPSKKRLLQVTAGEDTPQVIPLETLGLNREHYRSGYFRIHYMNPSNDLIWWHQKDSTDLFLVFHPREGIVADLEHKIDDYLTYGRVHITDIHFDSGEHAWVATEDGVFSITLKKNKFTRLLSDKSRKYSTRGITADHSGILHINSYNGRMLVHPEKKIMKVKDESGDLDWLGATKDHNGNLWFSKGSVIEKYDPETQKSQYYTYPRGEPYPPMPQWAIIRDKKGRVWTGARRGLYYLDPETDVYRKFNTGNTFSQLGNSTIYHLHEDEKGIWIAASSGVYLLEPGIGITRHYGAEEKPPYHIPYDHILHFHSDTTGIFWLATKGSGLVRFNPENGNYRQFTIADGLSNNTIYAVYEDAYHQLWLPSNYGLMQFNKKNYQVHTYLLNDGITHEEFNVTSHYQDDEGKLYFGGLAGITVFHPKDFTAKDMPAAPLRMTACKVLNGKTGALTDKTQSVFKEAQLVLSPSDKSFIIAFALLNYNNAQKNNYAYTITGLDKTWTPIEENRLRINGLPYGNYTLRIKGRSIKGESAANELVIPIVVRKPFYLQNGFLLSALLALGVLIYGMFQWRLQRLTRAKIQLQETVKQRTREISQQKDKIEKQAIKLKVLDSAKSRFFANISHELRNFGFTSFRMNSRKIIRPRLMRLTSVGPNNSILSLSW